MRLSDADCITLSHQDITFIALECYSLPVFVVVLHWRVGTTVCAVMVQRFASIMCCFDGRCCCRAELKAMSQHCCQR